MFRIAWRNLLLPFFVLSITSVACASSDTSVFQIASLRTEYLDSPLGVDQPPEEDPRVSWRIHIDSSSSSSDDYRGIYQESYQLEVSKSRVFVDTQVWDCSNGLVKSSKSHLIPLQCQGLTWESDTNYYWRVTVVLNDSSSTASAISSFRTGLLESSNWKARWITTGGNNTNKNLLRTEFDAMRPSSGHATLFVAGIGYHEVYLNGKKVGNHKLDPGWTNYNKRVWYATHDVSDHLVYDDDDDDDDATDNSSASPKKKKKNAIGVMLGNGWWSCGPPPGTNQPECQDFPPQLILQLQVDGKPVLVSDDDKEEGLWKAAQGPIVYNSLYNGEIYDARIAESLHGWTNVGFDDSTWTDAISASSPTTSVLLASQLFEPIRHVSTRVPQSITMPKPGVQVFDFGQNQAAVVHIKNMICGSRGTNITLRHGEVLNHPPYAKEEDGMIYVDNLRSAKSTDIYICRGGDDPNNNNGESYIPTFTQHGFRYVEITGLDYPLNEQDLEAVELHTDVQPTSSIIFSNPLLNQIQHLVTWSLKTNLMSVQTDCDQRDERRGWLGDAAMTAEAAVYNYGMGAFYTHWMEQIVDEQDEDGSVPNFVPSLGTSHGAPNWESAFPTILWVMLTYYGDEGIVTRHHDELVKYYGYFESNYNQTGIGNFMTGFGDWVPPPPASKADGHLTGAFAFLHDLQLGVELFSHSSHPEAPAIAKRISSLVQNLTKEYHDAFYNKDGGYYLSGLQTEQALPLFLGAVPESLIPDVVSYLLHDIQVTQSNHTTCGIVGIKYLMEILSILGHSDVALDLALQTTYPSWGYMIHSEFEPATTVWELWNSDDGGGDSMNSRNHHMFGTVSSWFYKYVAGIQPLEPGYATIKIHPTVMHHWNLTHVQARVVTPYGDVRSFWKREENNNTIVFTHEVSLPPGTSSVLVVPIVPKITTTLGSGRQNKQQQQHVRGTSTLISDSTTTIITEGGTPVWSDGHYVPGVAGVINATMVNNNDSVALELTNGRFHFETTIQMSSSSSSLNLPLERLDNDKHHQ